MGNYRGMTRQEYHRKWREKNPDKDKGYKRKARYGITQEQWDAQLAAQGGGCAVCSSTKKLSQDHNHTTGVNRAILCHLCNVTLGYSEESPSRLRKLADYLESWGG